MIGFNEGFVKESARGLCAIFTTVSLAVYGLCVVLLCMRKSFKMRLDVFHFWHLAHCKIFCIML